MANKSISKLGDGNALYLWVFPDGAKRWRFRFKFDGKEKTLALGTYPEVALMSARRLALDASDLLRKGTDPTQARKLAKIEKQLSAGNTFETVAWEWYDKQVHTWVKTHASDVERRLKANIIPFIGSRPISEITGPEMLAMIGKMERLGAFDLAHRVNGLAGQIFRYGIATGRCAFDISASIREAITPQRKKNQNAVPPDELPRLMHAISLYHQSGEMQTQVALQLLAHTFVRTGELIGATWNEVDLKKGVWAIPDIRMKMKLSHLVPLSKESIRLFDILKNMTGVRPYVLPGRNAMVPISNNTMLFALYRLGYKGRMTGHGFRAVASTVLNESGFNPDVIEKQLAHHEGNSVRKAYNRAQYLPERRAMMEWWSQYLLHAERDEEPPATPSSRTALLVSRVDL